MIVRFNLWLARSLDRLAERINAWGDRRAAERAARGPGFPRRCRACPWRGPVEETTIGFVSPWLCPACGSGVEIDLEALRADLDAIESRRKIRFDPETGELT